MNKFTVIASISLLVWLVEFAAFADLVVFPSGDAAWNVAVSPLKSESKNPSGGDQAVSTGKSVQKIEVTQVNNLRRTRYAWTDGTTTEEWSVPKLPIIFKMYPNGTVFPVEEGSLEAKAGSFGLPRDLSGFAWITPECLQEKDPVSYQGQSCYHYKGTAIGPAMLHASPMEETREAWINSKTLMPVELDTETVHCLFTFLPSPQNALEVPANFQQEIVYYKHVMGFP